MVLKKSVFFVVLILCVLGLASCATTWEPFTGDLLNYRFKHQGRDRAWEEDIIEFAFVALLHHPSVRYGAFVSARHFYRGERDMRVNVLEEYSHIRPEGLRDEFVSRVNELIENIPNLEDFEIVFYLSEISALLRDAHSGVDVDIDGSHSMIDIFFRHFYDGFYSAWWDLDHIVSGRLEAINGVAIDEIFESMRRVIPHEHEQAVKSGGWFLSHRGFLAHIGVLDIDEVTAEYTFSDEDGNLFTVSKNIFDGAYYSEMNSLLLNPPVVSFRHSRPSCEYYWFEYLSEYRRMYIRYARSFEIQDYPLSEFSYDIITTIHEVGGVERLIIDLRDNLGGGVLPAFFDFVDWLENNYELTGTVYILINSRTFSAGVMKAAILMQTLEHALLIGEPARQPPNFLVGNSIKHLPNSGLPFRISDTYIITWPNYEYGTLMPNVFIYETLADFLNGRDPVLRALSSPHNTDTQTNNLHKLAKVWGFAKYTHPAFLTGERCWDYELLALIPVVMSTDEDKVNDLLYAWFVSLGDDGYDNSPDDSVFYLFYEHDIRFFYTADLSWISDESFIGEPLAAAFSRFQEITQIDVLYAPFNFIGHSVFYSEQFFPEMDFTDVSYRLLGLFRLWNAMKYFFPYIYLIDYCWSDVLLEYIPVMLEGQNRRSYELALMAVAAKLSDTHVSISRNRFRHSPFSDHRNMDELLNFRSFMMEHRGQQLVLDNLVGNHMFPVRFMEAEGKIIVTHVGYTFENLASLRAGDVITALNGEKIEDVANRIMRYVSHTRSEITLPLFAENFLPFLINTGTEVAIVRGTEEMQVSVGTVYLRHNFGPTVPYMLLEGNIGLINPSLLSDNALIPDIMHGFADAYGLIIDMRQYPGHPTINELYNFIVHERMEVAFVTIPVVSVPGMFFQGGIQYSGGNTGDGIFHYHGNVVVLMNERTWSWGETAVMRLRNGANVTVIGSNSMGSNGDVTFLPLPGNLIMAYSGIGWYAHDGAQTQRIGLSPDIYVQRTVEAVREGRDELMEAALAFLSAQKMQKVSLR